MRTREIDQKTPHEWRARSDADKKSDSDIVRLNLNIFKGTMKLSPSVEKAEDFRNIISKKKGRKQ